MARTERNTSLPAFGSASLIPYSLLVLLNFMLLLKLFYLICMLLFELFNQLFHIICSFA